VSFANNTLAQTETKQSEDNSETMLALNTDQVFGSKATSEEAVREDEDASFSPANKDEELAATDTIFQNQELWLEYV